MRSMYDIQFHNNSPLEYWKAQLKVAEQIKNEEMISLSKRMIERYTEGQEKK